MKNEKKTLIRLGKDTIEFNFSYFTITLQAWGVIFLASIISIVSFVVFSKLGLVVAYNDARAHLDMGRLVFDNLTPGIVQIGSVWLPLNHLLELVFVWQYNLWQSGFAGAIWSMLAFVGTSYYIYKFCVETLENKSLAFLGALVFMTNWNVVYMQSTPMTELLLLFFFTASSYYLYLWAKEKKINYLITAAFFVLLATLTRYDGWFLFGYCVATIAFITFQDFYITNKEKLKNKFSQFWSLTESRLILFCTLGGFGIFLWLLWNKLIYGSALYFALGPYSAHAQQATIEKSGSLLTKGNILLSIKAYWWAMSDNIGFLLLLFAILGFAIYVYKNRIEDTALATYSLLSPMFFHIIALILGFSILVVPELGTSVTQGANTSWFNVRYGLMIIPAVSFFSAYLAKINTFFKVLLIILMIFYGTTFLINKNIVTITDGVYGTSSLDVTDVRDWLVANAKDKDGYILTSISYNNALAFSTGIYLKRFIHEGTGHYWTNSLKDPEDNARWIVMANGDVGDPVYTALIKKGNSEFLRYYDLKLRAKHTNIYELKEFPKGLVLRQDSQLTIDGKPFKFVGVNSYDLAYQAPQEIDQTLKLARDTGIGVVRFWAFGEGFKDSFQPNPGVYNEEKLSNLGYIVADAKKYNIKLIITLSNYWSDYGGIAQYLKWEKLPNQTPADLDKFFTTDSVKNLYKNYLQKIITYRNPYNNIILKDDTTIMAWELMNEPRSSSLSTSDTVVSWIDEMAGVVRSLDKNHIISAGTEGFTEKYNEGIGPLLNDITGLQSIELSTAHYYLKDSLGSPETMLSSWTKISQDNYDKPLIVEEVGFYKNPQSNNGYSREVLMSTVFSIAKQKNIDGILLWNWALKIDDSYGISPLDPDDKNLLNLIKDYSQSLIATSTKSN